MPNLTDDQVKARLQNLDKFSYGLNELRLGREPYFLISDLDELNNHYFAIFGAFNNIHCQTCRAIWLGFLQEWYFENKQKYENNTTIPT